MPDDPEIAYRYFDQADHAQRLVDCYVWVSTVDHIRKCNGLRGDVREMTWAYRPDGLDSLNDDEATRATLESLNIKVATGGRVRVSGNSIVVKRKHPNAFMLCASEFPPTPGLVRTFGKHCVKIDCVPAFWNAITARLWELDPGVGGGDFARVTYGRTFVFGDRVDSVVFAGTEGNEFEGEIRLFWTVEHPERIEPFQLHVPYIADTKMCTLVPLPRD